MMEYWNVDFEKEKLDFQRGLLLFRKGCEKADQVTCCNLAPKAHYSTIPVFPL
jgi:hypothetical protein